MEGLLAAYESPPLTIFRIDQCSKYPNWVFTCVTGEISSVNSDIKCPVRRTEMLHHLLRCKNLGRCVQP